jgi:hypothetical protein
MAVCRRSNSKVKWLLGTDVSRDPKSACNWLPLTYFFHSPGAGRLPIKQD